MFDWALNTPLKCIFHRTGFLNYFTQLDVNVLTPALHYNNKQDKVFKNRTSKFCGRQPLKQPLKILLGPFLSTLSQMKLMKRTFRICEEYMSSMIKIFYLSQYAPLFRREKASSGGYLSSRNKFDKKFLIYEGPVFIS